VKLITLDLIEKPCRFKYWQLEKSFTLSGIVAPKNPFLPLTCIRLEWMNRRLGIQPLRKTSQILCLVEASQHYEIKKKKSVRNCEGNCV